MSDSLWVTGRAIIDIPRWAPTPTIWSWLCWGALSALHHAFLACMIIYGTMIIYIQWFIYIYIYIYTVCIQCIIYDIWCVFVCLLRFFSALSFVWMGMDNISLFVCFRHCFMDRRIVWWCLMGNVQRCDTLKCSHVISWCVFKCSPLSHYLILFQDL